MGDSINLKEYVDMFKRRKGIIILVMLVCLVMGAYKTYRNYISYKPTYSSTVTVRINTTKNFKQNKEDKEDGSNQYTDPYSSYNISQNQNIASSYSTLATSPNVYSIVASSLKISPADVGSISATQREDMMEFIDITVTSNSAEIAKKVAERVPEAFNQELINMIGIDCVQVIYKASEGTLIPRGKDVTIAKYAVMGLVLSIFLVLLRECLDTKIVTPDDVVKYWDYPLLGTIPMDVENKKGKRYN